MSRLLPILWIRKYRASLATFERRLLFPELKSFPNLLWIFWRGSFTWISTSRISR